MLDNTANQELLNHIYGRAAKAEDYQLAEIIRMTVNMLNDLSLLAARRELITGYRVIEIEHPDNGLPTSNIVVSVMTEVI